MRKNMAELLRNELVANVREIDMYNQKGTRERPEIVNSVYNGLLLSGNMRYLMDHQSSLHLLYVSMGRNEPDVASTTREKITSLEKIFT